MSTLGEYLEFGRLGAVGGDVSEEMVREHWGEPDDISVQTNPAIWKYGPVQLSFYKGRSDSEPTLKSLQLRFDPNGSLPDRLVIEGWWPSPETSLIEFREQIAREGIDSHSKVDSPPRTHLALASGARATFNDDRLQSIQWTSRREPQAKQVTVFVPTPDLERISKIASDSKLSVSSLCSKWISEHLNELSSLRSI